MIGKVFTSLGSCNKCGCDKIIARLSINELSIINGDRFKCSQCDAAGIIKVTDSYYGECYIDSNYSLIPDK